MLKMKPGTKEEVAKRKAKGSAALASDLKKKPSMKMTAGYKEEVKKRTKGQYVIQQEGIDARSVRDQRHGNE